MPSSWAPCSRSESFGDIDVSSHFTDPFGRTGRLMFLGLVLATLVVQGVAAVFLIATSTQPMGTPQITPVGWLFIGILGAILFTIPAMRRFHDVGLPGWWVISLYIPVIGWLTVLMLLFVPGMKARNPWGDPPQASSL